MKNTQSRHSSVTASGTGSHVEGFDRDAAEAYIAGAGLQLVAALSALTDLEHKLERRNKRRAGTATAAGEDVDPVSITKKIDALRGQFENQSLQVRYESKQKLASLLREISHVLTDLIHSMSVCGDNTDAMKKLQKQIFNVTTSLSFTGKGDADRDGFKDEKLDSIGLGEGKSTKDSSKDAFLAAVKSLQGKDNKSAEDKPALDAEKSEKPAKDEGPHGPVPDNFKKHLEEVKEKKAKPDSGEDADSDADSDNGDDDGDSKKSPFSKKEKKLLKKKAGKKSGKAGKEGEGGSDSKGGGFVDGLLSDASSSGVSGTGLGAHVVVAGLRFAYLGLKKVKKNGKTQSVIVAAFGVHDKPNMKVYYYVPSVKFFKGDAAKVDKALTQLLSTPGGYSLVSTELNARVRSKHLEVIHVEEKPAKEILAEASTWSFKGTGQHPKKEERKALWFEIKNQLFAAVPAKDFENGDVDEAANYIRLRIVGSKKEGAPGLSYLDGLAKLEHLVSAKKLKVIFHGSV